MDRDCRGLLLLESKLSCFLFGDVLKDGDTPVREDGVSGGEPLIEGTHSIFSGDGVLRLRFSFSSPKSTKSFNSGDFLTLKSSGADESLIKGGSFDLLTVFRTSVWVVVGAEMACDMGWMVPLGSRKHGVSGFGMPETFGSIPGSILAPRNREYGTIIIGFVGNAKKGCWGRGAFGEGGVLHVEGSTGEVGVEPEVQLVALLLALVAAAGFTCCLIMCLELQ